MKSLIITFSIICFNIYSINAQEYARIISQSTNYQINSIDDVVISEKYELKINSREGDRYATFFEYIDKFRSIRNVKITIKDASGNKVDKLSKADGHEFGFNSSYEIDDSKIFVIRPEYQRYPFFVEVEYEIKIDGFISLPTWTPRSYFNLAVEEANFKITHPNNFEINLRNEFIDPIKVETEEEWSTYYYQVKELEAIDRTIRYKDFIRQQPKVRISPKQFSLNKNEGSFKTWSSFGDWFLDLNNEPYELSESTKKYIDSLDRSNKTEFIRSIYQYMQERTRYISIQLGIGGYKSIPTQEVENNGYGDCKALTTYMKNMLDYAGIKSNYILVNAGHDTPDILPDFPSNQFNHVYLGIPSADTLYLECTSQTIPAFYTGKFTDDRNVLWVEKNASKIIRSTKYGLDDNIKVNVADIKVDENGDAIISLNTQNEGVFYDEINIYMNGADDYVKNYNQNQMWFKDFTISDFAYNQPNKNQPKFESNYKLSVIGFGRRVGDRLLIPINTLRPIQDIIDESSLKQYAEITRAITVIDSVSVTLPKNYWIFDLPEEFTVESIYGSYNFNIEFDNAQLKMYRNIKLKEGEYTKEDYEGFSEFFDQLKKFEKKKLLLSEKT